MPSNPRPGLPRPPLNAAMSIVLGLAAASASAAAPLDTCRSARTAGTRDALAVCNEAAAALQRSTDNEGAFEALMHTAELATQQSEAATADEALARAQQLLPSVNDPLAAHRLHRRRGLLAYHRGQPVAALGEFLEALSAAAAGEGASARAVSHNDLGVVYQKLGDYTTALEHFQRSLDLKNDRDEVELAVSFANVGSLYRRLGDTPQAERFLQRALAAQEHAGQAVPAARTREELGQLRAASGDAAAAAGQFDAAWQVFAQAALARDQMRVALHRANLEATRGNVAAARDWLQRARTAASTIGRETVLPADLVDLAVADDAAGRRLAADALARNLARAGDEDPAVAVDGYARLAEYHEQAGDSAAALQALRNYVRHAEALTAARHDERLDALRVRFDLATLEAERDRLALEQLRQAAEIERVGMHRLGIVALALLLLGALATLFRHRLYRQRVRADNERLQLQQRIAQARDAATALRTDVRSLAWLLDRGQVAALVFDAAGCVRGITPAAAQRLGVEAGDASGRTLQQLMDPAVAAWAQQQIEQASLDGDMPATIAPNGDRTLRCERLAREEELGVLSWNAAEAGEPAPLADAEAAAPVAPAAEFRAALVQLMQASLTLWERITLKTRIDLAERSGVWRITVDEGRLRVRAMDRYLDIDSLPERPRWREVLRTAYFVLAELPLDVAQRADLEARIAQVRSGAPRRGGV